MSGAIISISGTDGSGKSTQSHSLVEALEKQGYQASYFWTRGGHTPLLDSIRKLFGHKKEAKRQEGDNLNAITETDTPTKSPAKKKSWKKTLKERVYMSISLLDLARIYGINMRLMKRQYDFIVCDRYLLDTLVDFSIRFPGNQVDKWLLWHLVLWFTPEPAVSIFLRTSVEVSNQRLIANDDPEDEYPVGLPQRLAYYDRLAEKHQWTVLSGEDSIEEIKDNVLKNVLQSIEAK